MLHILYGEDSYSRQARVEAIKSGLGPPDALATNTSLIDGREATVQQLKQACETAPFLAPYRLVIVEGLLGRFDERTGGGRRGRRSDSEQESAEWTAFAEYLPGVPPTTVVVLVDGKLKKGSPLLRALSKAAQVQEFPPLRSAELVPWIESQAAQRGGRIAPEAVRLLADLVGPDLWQLTHEIDKLLTFTQGRPIQEADVRALVSNAREAGIFNLVDAVVEGRKTLALRMLEQLINEGTEPSQVLTMLARQTRLVLLAQDLLAQGVSPSEIGPRLGLTADFALRKTLAQARTVSPQRAIALHRRLLDADLAIKTGRMDGVAALEVLVAEAVA